MDGEVDGWMNKGTFSLGLNVLTCKIRSGQSNKILSIKCCPALQKRIDNLRTPISANGTVVDNRPHANVLILPDDVRIFEFWYKRVIKLELSQSWVEGDISGQKSPTPTDYSTSEHHPVISRSCTALWSKLIRINMTIKGKKIKGRQ